MKISKARTKARQMGYTVELSEYDAEPPARAWLIDEFPDTVNPELEAMALYLIFGRWCGGEFTVPRKMGPNTAGAIARDSVAEMFCSPIEFYPKALPSGTNQINLTEDVAKAGRKTLVNVPSSDWNGSIRSTDAVVVASNSNVFKLDESDIRPLVAIGLLFADTLGADELHLLDDQEPSPFTDLDRLGELVGHVRIGLSSS